MQNGSPATLLAIGALIRYRFRMSRSFMTIGTTLDPTHRKTIARLAFKLAGLLILRQILIAGAIWGFFWGTLVLALRFAFNIPRLDLMWGAAGILAAAVLAVFLTRRRLPSRAIARALVDRESCCGGLLMAGGEIDLGSWQSEIPQLRTPRIRWRAWRICGLFAAACLFVTISFLIPSRFITRNPVRALEIEAEVADLTTKVQKLKNEDLLDSSRAAFLEEELKQVKQEASGDDPVRTWESLDHLENTIAKETEKAAQTALDLTDKLTKAETLAKALLESGATPHSELMTEAMQGFLGMLADSGEGGFFEKQLLARSWKAGDLSPESLKRLAAALRGSKAEILERLKRLHALGLIDREVLGRCTQLGKCDSAGLAAFLSENAGSENAGEVSVQELVRALGAAPTRGRGDAEMTWRDEISEKGARFTNQGLPPAAIADQGELIGLSAGAPSVTKAHSIAKPGALDKAAGAGGGAHTQTILPRHRGSVKRYFDRP